MAENAPYRIRNVVPAKNTKSATCSPIDFQNTSPYPSDWNQRRSTQYDNPTRPERMTPKVKAAKKMILRRFHAELRCSGEPMKSGNFPPVLDHLWANILIVGFLQRRASMQRKTLLIAKTRESGTRCSYLSGCKLGFRRHPR